MSQEFGPFHALSCCVDQAQPLRYGSGVADQPAAIDAEKIAAWLTDEFGGTWRHWKGGPAGIPDADLWAQFRDDPDGKTVLVGMLLLADGITSARLRSVPVGVLEDAAAQQQFGGEAQLRADLAKLPPLERGDLSTDDFYRLVAEHFKVWARHGRQPVAAMVRQSGEKSPTVHGWVNRARARGFLPEVERGKKARPGG